MSRTDKTDPWPIKEEWYRVHFPRATADDRALGLYRYYEWWRGAFRCGCPMCGYDAFETPRRIKERLEGKRLARDWWREY